LKDLNLYALVKPLEDVEKGHTATRREWYLSDAEIKLLLANVDQLDLLLFIWLELQCGARPISMVSTKVSDINFEKEYITYFESKKKTQGERYFIAETFQLLQAYISDMHIGKFDRLFKQHQNVYSDAFKKLGVALGIELFKQEGAAAYTLRHTFATQSSDHDVSLEVVMSQGGWSESSTLMKHYVAVKTSKKKRELLGVIEEKPLNFGDWIKQFVPIVKDSLPFAEEGERFNDVAFWGGWRCLAALLFTFAPCRMRYLISCVKSNGQKRFMNALSAGSQLAQIGIAQNKGVKACQLRAMCTA
jgi:hypothetical protein